MQTLQRFIAKLSVVLLILVGGSGAHAASVASAVDDNLSQAVKSTTGVNPNDYPCAKAGIVNLFQKRQEIASLSSWHPQRIFTWMLDVTVYYTHATINFFKNLFSPGAIESGIRRIHAMATSGGNPLDAATRSIDGAMAGVNSWATNLGSRSQSVLKDKVHGIIDNTTNEDGSCKK